MIAWLIYGIVSFLVHALALKLAVGVVADSRENTYGTALGLAALFTVLGAFLSLIPILGWIVYLVIWMVVVTSVYKIGVLRGIGVALIQTVLHFLLAFGLRLLGVHI